jgi:hypothetical protein
MAKASPPKTSDWTTFLEIRFQDRDLPSEDNVVIRQSIGEGSAGRFWTDLALMWDDDQHEHFK